MTSPTVDTSSSAATSKPASAVAVDAAFASKLSQVLPRLLGQPGALPDDWTPTATTYDLPRFDSPREFAKAFDAALTSIIRDDVHDAATLRERLAACGLPYDYARLGQPLSTVYEMLVHSQTSAARVFSFASVTKPWLSVIENPQRRRPVRVLVEGVLPISAALRSTLAVANVEIQENQPRATLQAIEPNPEVLTVLVLASRFEGDLREVTADAVCYPLVDGGMLLIKDASRIDPHDIQVVRKRTVSALLAADALRELERHAGVTSKPEAQADAASCDAALRDLFPEVTQALYFCTGLAAEAAVFAAAVEAAGPGPVTFFYAQNGYGGTGQLITDILAGSTALVPAPLPVMEDASGEHRSVLVDKIIERLGGLEGAAACVFLETPTNPQLQMHDMAALVEAVRAYEKTWGRTVPILVDTTLAPLYPALGPEVAQDWPFVLIKSGSKYFTKGKTTLGVTACGSHPTARAIVTAAGALGADADSFAKPGQLALLQNGLRDLRERMAEIAKHTAALSSGMRAALAARGHDVTLYAMAPEQVEAGLACGLISFYLPPAPSVSGDLVDAFVDSMLSAAPQLVKSRVSYGQSTGGGKPDFFYIINPQESTQGALSDEVKNAQKRDNVQICRISVPAKADVPGLLAKMELFFDQAYGPR